MLRELRQYTFVPNQARKQRSQFLINRSSDNDIDYENYEEGLNSNSFTSAETSSTALEALPTRNPGRPRRRRDNKKKLEKTDNDDDTDSGNDDDSNDDEEDSFIKTSSSTSYISSATSKSIITTTTSFKSLPTPESKTATITSSFPTALRETSDLSSVPTSSITSGGISSAAEVTPLQQKAKTSEAALLGSIFGVMGAAFLAVIVVLAVRYRRKRLAEQTFQDDDQDPIISSRDTDSVQGRWSTVWGGSAANTEYRPPAQPKHVSYQPQIVGSVGDRFSRLWGSSQATSVASPLDFGFDQNEKTGPIVPPVPPIPVQYGTSPAQLREAKSYPTLPQDFDPPPTVDLASDTASITANKSSRVHDGPSMKTAFDRQSVASIPRFRTAESWVEDQTKRLQRAGNAPL